MQQSTPNHRSKSYHVTSVTEADYVPARFTLKRSVESIKAPLMLERLSKDFVTESKTKLRNLMTSRPASNLKFIRLDSLKEEVSDKRTRSLRKIRKIDQSFEQVYDDEVQRSLTGERAVEQYNDAYRRFDLVKDQNELQQLADSAQTSMIAKSIKHNLLPCKIGLVKRDGDPRTLNAQQYGDKYMKMVGAGLAKQNGVLNMNLRRNRMTSVGAIYMLQHARKVEHLDISRNRIGQASCERLSKVLDSKECALRELNLQRNLIGDALRSVFEGLHENRTLLYLNLSENMLSDVSALQLEHLLLQNNYIQELSLRWNLIGPAGGSAIFSALVLNESLRVLDFSYNQLGSRIAKRQSNCMPQLRQFFENNLSVVHLDLSVNNFTLSECKQIKDVHTFILSKALKQNHSIYGFHFAGNYGYIDAKGFLQLKEGQISPQYVQEVHLTQPIKGVQMREESRHRQKYDIAVKDFRDICWICEGWQQQTFIFESDAADPRFLHCDFNHYTHEYIGTGTMCRLDRMLPSGEVRYFYSADHKQIWSKGVDLHRVDALKMGTDSEQLAKKFGLVTLQTVHIALKSSVIDTQYKINVTVQPRTVGLRYRSNVVPTIKKWSFPISIWARDYRFEDDDLLLKCFQKDWSCVKVPKFVKNPLQLTKLQDLLWKYYRSIKNTYRQISSYYPQGDVWCISWNALTEFILSVGLVDNKTLKLSDVDLKFIATYSASVEQKGNPRNPDRSLIRYQFIEFLVRLAEDKYLKNGLAADYVEATSMILAQCESFLNQFDHNQWRNDRYFTEECDYACKHYRVIVENVYRRFSRKQVKPGQRRFMCLDELSEICKKADLFDESFVDRDVNLAFNLAMMTQIDELDSDRVSQMTWIECMEALARVADKSPGPQPLHLKYEKLMLRLLDKVVDEELRQQFQRPIKGSIFVERAALQREDSVSEFDY